MVKDLTKAFAHASRVLDLWLPEKIKYARIPGIAVGITHKGRLVYAKGFGYSNIASKEKITPKTVFRIASISKPFTAIAIMQLVEQKKLKLDEPVNKYLKWFEGKSNKGELKNITIRQLLSHTGGVFRDGRTAHWETDRFPDEEELKESISKDTITFRKMTRFKYSNFGFAVLGELIKEVSGMNYEEYMRREILTKLGMENTYPDISIEMIDSLATGYSRPIPGEKRLHFKHSKTHAYAPATGFASNVADLAKFVSALSIKKGSSILTRESKKKLMKKERQISKKNKDYHYGLGLEIYKINNKKIIGHSGGFPGFITKISLDVNNDIGVISLSNTLGSSAIGIAKGIMELVHFLLEKEKDLDNVNSSQMKYEGVYRNRWGDLGVISLGTKMLVFEIAADSPNATKNLLMPQREGDYLIESPEGFDYSGESAKFLLGKDGRVSHFRLGSTIYSKIKGKERLS